MTVVLVSIPDVKRLTPEEVMKLIQNKLQEAKERQLRHRGTEEISFTE